MLSLSMNNKSLKNTAKLYIYPPYCPQYNEIKTLTDPILSGFAIY